MSNYNKKTKPSAKKRAEKRQKEQKRRALEMQKPAAKRKL